MRISKFRIRNFKSIIDSGYCTLASDLTILIGKNESGKTATLEALKYFNKDILRVQEEAFPLDASRGEPLVEICFHLEREEINAIQEASGVHLAEGAQEYILQEGLKVTKDSRGRYGLHEDCVGELFSGNGGGNGGAVKLTVKHIRSAKERLQTLLKVPQLPPIDYDSSEENIQRESKEFIRAVKTYLPSVKDEQIQTEVVKAIRVIVKESVKLTQPQAAEEEGHKEQRLNSVAFFIERFVERMPHFIFFTEFSDILPFSVPIDELKKSQPVLDFAKISGLDLDYFLETRDVQRRINYLNRHSTSINGNFLEYWNQNRVELVVKSEGENLIFGVKEQDKPDFFKVEQRSKGFQWFLSFYLRLNAQKSRHNVLLIDEPGIHLHAKAQKEILKVLENEIAGDGQVIFSTHCPYLIDPRRLDRVRLVLKDPKTGTVISGDIHAHAREESMAPVVTAMGGERTHTAPLPSKHNVIVGSVHDFYFWKAMKEYMAELNLGDIHLLPAADVQQTEHLVSLMVGYCMDFQLLLDHDNDSWKAAQKLKEKFGFGDEKIIYVCDKPGYFTEDLFTLEDFNKHVLNGDPNTDEAVLNSIYLKNNAKSKVLFAREFYDKVEKNKEAVNLSDQTVAAFRKVFDTIHARFHVVTVAGEGGKGLNDADGAQEQNKPSKGGIKRRSLFAFLRKQ